MSTLLDSDRRRARRARLLALLCCTFPSQAPSVDAARARITRADLEAHVRFLASDELRGRRTGEPEAVVAARWLAAALEKSGVEPAGDAGTFLQRVPMHQVARLGAPRLTLTTKSGESVELVYGIDFDQADVLRDVKLERVVVVSTKADFPEQPSGSIALVLPDSRSERRALLEAAHTPNGEGWGLVLTLGPDTPGKEAKNLAGPPSLRVDHGDAAGQRLRIRGAWKQRLVAGDVTGLALVANVERVAVETYNVVGVVRGRGEKASEALVVSAHYDHLGVATKASDAPSTPDAAEVDVIYNGADDDASGCAIVLELADALAHSGKPDRTTIFFLATGEEVGLLGTDWYLEHPFVPLEKTVLNLNFEMLGRPDALVGGAGKVWLTGDERSNLGAAFRARGLEIVADPRPDQNFFQRSDNMAFVRRGIVGQSLSTYDLHQDYHHVSDEWDTLDYAHMETCARTSFDALLLVVDDAFEPAWAEGQDFKR